MWQGKYKAFTLSFDDGIEQDAKLIALLESYGLKATFNLNTGLAGRTESFVCNGVLLHNRRWTKEEAKEVYRGQEVAAHTLTHRNLTSLSEEEAAGEAEEDRRTLEEWFSRPVYGMAYPCGGVNNDERTAEILGRRTKVKFARTIDASHSFSLPPKKRFLRLPPTVHQAETEQMQRLTDEFLLAEGSPEQPLLFFLWGHAYEYECFSGLEEALKRTLDKLCARGDVFFGTNSEVRLEGGGE